MSRIDDAVKLFENGYMCSQAVFGVFSEELGLCQNDALKIGACFGSGMRKAEVCGACTGALMAIGLKYGDDKQKSNVCCEKFLDEFEKENGSYICRELLECDISTSKGVEYALSKNLFKEFCPLMVESATKSAKKSFLWIKFSISNPEFQDTFPSVLLFHDYYNVRYPYHYSVQKEEVHKTLYSGNGLFQSGNMIFRHLRFSFQSARFSPCF